MNSKIQLLQCYLKEHKLDAIFITNNTNRRYYSDFLGSDGYLLIGKNFQLLITDSRYTIQAEQEAKDFEIYTTVTRLSEWFNDLITKYSIKKLGFESSDMNCNFYNIINSCVSIEMIPIDSDINSFRSIKTANEVSLIKKAIKISDDAIINVENNLKAGITEKQLAWEIEKFMRDSGSEQLPFDVIVASGINAAKPHHIPSSKEIKEEEPIVIDIGARFDGYASDLTRTITLGNKTEMFNKIYNIVLKAQLEAEEKIKANMTGYEADKIARDVIEEAGYGNYFGHALGHGIGLDCHEYPTLSCKSNQILKNGMVFTIEPGIYIPEWGGVRIEDTVLLENNSITKLSQVHK